jgi:hypothetical protein
MFKTDLFGGHVTKEQLKLVLMQPPNTDTINELYKQTKIKVVFDTKTHVSITFLILSSSSRL